jgi:scavenger receptor class B, member 1
VDIPILILQAATTVASELSFFAALALSTLTKALNAQPILNITVYDYLWGYEDNLVKLASNIVPSFITFEKLGLLDRVSTFVRWTEKFKVMLCNIRL